MAASTGQVEGEAHDALAADLGEQGRLDSDLAARATPGEVAAAHPGVLALAVLPHDDPVQLGVIGLAQRAPHPRQEADRPDVRPLVEVLADGQPQAPQADVVGHTGPADRAEVDGIEVLEDLEPVGRHHPPGAPVVSAAPLEFPPVERKRAPAPGGQRVEHLAPGGHHLLAHAVGGDRRDPEPPGRVHRVARSPLGRIPSRMTATTSPASGGAAKMPACAPSGSSSVSTSS